MKARLLRKLRVKRVDLCFRGANQAADVVLFKSDDFAKAITDEDRSALVADLKDMPLKDVSATVRRLAMFAAQGHVLEGFDKQEMEWLYHAAQKELDRRKREAGEEPSEHAPMPTGKQDEPTDEDGDIEKWLPPTIRRIRERSRKRTSEEKAAMPKCKKCEHEMKADDKFCPKCGTPKDETESAAKAAKEKHMAENQEQLAELKKALDAATAKASDEAAKRAEIEKTLKDQGETITSLKKANEDAQAQIKKAQDDAKLAEFRKVADEFEGLPVKAETFAPILKACAEALDKAGFDELMRALKAGDRGVAESFIELGAPGDGSKPRTAAEEIEAKAEELMKADGKIQKTEAYVRVMATNAKLAARYRREARSKPSQDDES